jgi:hypothetical protein
MVAQLCHDCHRIGRDAAFFLSLSKRCRSAALSLIHAAARKGDIATVRADVSRTLDQNHFETGALSFVDCDEN